MPVDLTNQPFRYIGFRATLNYPGDLGSILGDSGSSTKRKGAHAAYCPLQCRLFGVHYSPMITNGGHCNDIRDFKGVPPPPPASMGIWGVKCPYTSPISLFVTHNNDAACLLVLCSCVQFAHQTVDDMHFSWSVLSQASPSALSRMYL